MRGRGACARRDALHPISIPRRTTVMFPRAWQVLASRGPVDSLYPRPRSAPGDSLRCLLQRQSGISRSLAPRTTDGLDANAIIRYCMYGRVALCIFFALAVLVRGVAAGSGLGQQSN
ncbi:hypothetical protein AURDEDRAFT_175830 [Auricularia subglabra TFB-10046 SS5]|uniref:Uncharacterized protein n=1 Tax=Auricularia subglabra (strain TFB-10046 / SS5) TaxID=717982 RepID=J0LE55_AURST|nr:hypothetical protein AURDEDRAFT_175830 [Auricularia subglabra TFB-10046 SS5]